MTLLDVRNLSVEYFTRDRATKALDDVSLTLDEGDSIGIVGESGCGKSTLLFAISRLLRSNARYAGGEVRIEEQEILSLPERELAKLRWTRFSMVFQSAMNALNPVIRIGKLLSEAYRAHHPKAGREEVRNRVFEVLDLVRIDRNFANSYAHELSGGMRQRVVIALAIICGPRLLLADEPTTALDVLLQKQIMEQLADLQKRLSFGLVLVTHDLSLVAETCRRIVIMYAGQIVEMGDTDEVLSTPRHPYTIGLLQSFPTLNSSGRRLTSIAGHPPDLSRPMEGCRFADRCPFAETACRTAQIELTAPPQSGASQLARCRRMDLTASTIGRLERTDAIAMPV